MESEKGRLYAYLTPILEVERLFLIDLGLRGEQQSKAVEKKKY